MKLDLFVWIVLVVLVVLVATLGAGCSGEGSSVAPSDELPTAQRGEEHEATYVPTLEPQKEEEEVEEEEEAITLTQTPEAMEVELPAGAAQPVTLAREDLARRLGLALEAIGIVSVEAVEWPDASLGCPQPGMMYAQVVTPGFRLVLEAQGASYEYHTDRAQTVILCEEEPTMDVPTMSGEVEPGLEPLVNQAKEDLAHRLLVSVDEIEVLEARSVVWPDASLGCPQPGMRYRQVPMDGARILLAVEGQTYAYHSGGGRDPFLCEQITEATKGTPEPLELIPPSDSESD